MRRAWLLLAAVVLGGCETATGPGPAGLQLIRTDQASYVLSRDPGYDAYVVDIAYSYENRTGAPIYLLNCNGGFAVLLQRLEGGVWVTAWGNFVYDCLSPAIVIEPDGTYADVLHVWGAKPGVRAVPRFDVADPSGVYRMVVVNALSSFRRSPPFGDPIPLSQRVSNSFRLRAP